MTTYTSTTLPTRYADASWEFGDFVATDRVLIVTPFDDDPMGELIESPSFGNVAVLKCETAELELMPGPVFSPASRPENDGGVVACSAGGSRLFAAGGVSRLILSESGEVIRSWESDRGVLIASWFEEQVILAQANENSA